MEIDFLKKFQFPQKKSNKNFVIKKISSIFAI